MKTLLAMLLLAFLAGCAAAPRHADTPAAREAIHATGPAAVRASLDLALAGVGRDDEVWIIQRRPAPATAPVARSAGGGMLIVAGRPDQPVAPARTTARATVTGCIACVEITQELHNPLPSPADVTYRFRLPDGAAVDDFLLLVGQRRIRGILRQREDAQRLYELARERGHAATLLAQDPSGDFQQSVANIPASARIDLRLRYAHPLCWADGALQFLLPLPLAGQMDVSINLDAGLPIAQIASPTHDVQPRFASASRATIALSGESRGDLVLTCRPAGDSVRAAAFTYRDLGGQYLAVMLLPHPSSPATGLSIDFGDNGIRPLEDLAPARMMLILRRMERAGTIAPRIRGRCAGQTVDLPLAANLDRHGGNPALPTLYAAGQPRTPGDGGRGILSPETCFIVIDATTRLPNR